MIETDPYIGQVLDEKYRLERLLGRGGMGAVYLATHLGTERYVALKLITPQLMRNEEFVARFKREARAAGRLRHPNVVDVTDFGFAHAGKEAVAYLVMEYLDGCTTRRCPSIAPKQSRRWARRCLRVSKMKTNSVSSATSSRRGNKLGSYLHSNRQGAKVAKQTTPTKAFND